MQKTIEPRSAHNVSEALEWPRDFDFRASRAEQQELLLPPVGDDQTEMSVEQ